MNIKDLVESTLTVDHVIERMDTYFRTLSVQYMKHEVEDTSSPAAPDTSKFRASHSGKIKVTRNTPILSSPSRAVSAVTLQVGSAIALDVYKDIKSQVINYAKTKFGATVRKNYEGSEEATIECVDGRILVYSQYGTNYSQIFVRNLGE